MSKKKKSHGRLHFLSFLAVAGTGVVFLGAGVALTLGVVETHEAQFEKAQIDSLRIQSEMIRDAVTARLSELRAEAVAIRSSRAFRPKLQDAPLTESRSILHWAEVRWIPKKKRASRVFSARNPYWNQALSLVKSQHSNRQVFFEDFYEARILERIRGGDFRRTQPMMIRFPKPGTRSEELIAIGFPVKRLQRLLFVLVDSDQLFRVIRKVGHRDKHATLRSYVVADGGKVLAHSQRNYLGNDFSKTGVYADAARQLLGSKKRSRSGVFRGIDRVPVAASVRQIGALPFVLVVAKPLESQLGFVSSWEVLEFFGNKGLLALGGLVVFGLLMIFLLRSLVRRSQAKSEAVPVEIETSPYAESATDDYIVNDGGYQNFESEFPRAGRVESPVSVAPQAPHLEVPESPMLSNMTRSFENHRRAKSEAQSIADELANQYLSHGAQKSGQKLSVVGARPDPSSMPPHQMHRVEEELRQTLRASQNKARRSEELKQHVARFEVEAARMKHPKRVAERLAQAAAGICESPVLFFNYSQQTRTANLQADAGFEAGTAPATLSFPVRPELMKKVVLADDGEAIPVSDYTPLQDVVMSRLGVAHFEAYAVSGFGHLGRQSRRPRLLGVLVVLQPGFESVAQKDSVDRILRATGLIYENSLLSSS